jgi:hypothetical protein
LNEIGEKGRTGSAWKRGGGRERESMAGRKWGWGTVRRNDPNDVCTYEYMNKEEKKEMRGPTLLSIMQ